MNNRHIFRSTAIALVVATAFGVQSCVGGGSSNNELGDVPVDDRDSGLVVSGEVVSDMIQNISSPVEMANEVKGTGVGFSQGILNPAGMENKYETSFKKAVNLGVYAADLGYINTFNKNLVVVDYLGSIKRLADGIGVGQFLDFTTLTRLAKNSTNLDSLKQLSVTSFNDIDRYLREQNRSNVSTAIVVGTWVEGIYITSQVINQTHDKGLIDRLGEQKDIVEILRIVINTYSKSDRDYKALSGKIEELKHIYEGVKVTTEMGEPETQEIDGMLIIVQNEITHIDISEEQVKSIIAKINEIRSSLVE
ncbi:MAG: hypothetical protein II951_12915 [Bacteroidales bacterium]|nr:hypothetical protein [Bacteroidales bacterium]